LILHTLNKAHSHNELNKQLFTVCTNDDSVLLIEDGLYQLLSPALFSTNDHWSSQVNKIYALCEDAVARGINIDDMDHALSHISFVSYEGFVTLAAAHDKTISWY